MFPQSSSDWTITCPQGNPKGKVGEFINVTLVAELYRNPSNHFIVDLPVFERQSMMGPVIPASLKFTGTDGRVTFSLGPFSKPGSYYQYFYAGSSDVWALIPGVSITIE